MADQAIRSRIEALRDFFPCAPDSIRFLSPDLADQGLAKSFLRKSLMSLLLFQL